MTDLTKIDKPFGELDIETKVALFRAWCEGAIIESSSPSYGPEFFKNQNPLWVNAHVYRVQHEPLRDISVPCTLTAEAKVAMLVDALRFYADIDGYGAGWETYDPDCIGASDGHIIRDGGDMARAVLAEIEGCCDD